MIAERIPGTATGLVLLDQLFERPMVTVNATKEIIGRSYPVANNLVSTFRELGLLREVTGQQRNRVFAYPPLLELFD